VVAKVVDEPVCTDIACVDTPVNIRLIAVIVAVGVIGASIPSIIYLIVETWLRVKMLADLLL
jgi:hypothetical protein